MRTGNEKRFNPPQWAGILIACAVPLAVTIIYVACFTDWLQQVWVYFGWFGQFVAGLPWDSIGQCALTFSTATVGALLIFAATLLLPNCFDILHNWKLSLKELIRLTVFTTLGVAVYCVLLLRTIHWTIDIYQDCAANPTLLKFYTAAFWMFLVLAELGFVAYSATFPNRMVYHQRAFLGKIDMSVLLPRYFKLAKHLADSAEKLSAKGRFAKNKAYLGDGEYGFAFPDSDTRDKWIRENLPTLEEYASHHGSLEHELNEWKEQHRED